MKMTFMLVAVMIVGCSEQPMDVESTTGPQLFEAYCAGCHKTSGKGNFLAGIPANSKTALDGAAIVELILDGLSSHKDMPVFDKLSTTQAQQIADHLLTLNH